MDLRVAHALSAETGDRKADLIGTTSIGGTGSNNSVLVTGANSVWTNAYQIRIPVAPRPRRATH